MNHNFYADHHGKCARDSHFSQVSRFVRDYSIKKKLENAQDVADAINQGQQRANENSI